MYFKAFFSREFIVIAIVGLKVLLIYIVTMHWCDLLFVGMENIFTIAILLSLNLSISRLAFRFAAVDQTSHLQQVPM